MTTDNFSFYIQNRQIQTRQTGGKWYSDISTLVFPGLRVHIWQLLALEENSLKSMNYALVIRHLAQMSHDLHLYVKQDKLTFGQCFKTSLLFWAVS